MLNTQLAVKYAQALFILAKEKGLLGEIQEQLTQVIAVAGEHRNLQEMLYHPLIPAKMKKETISKVFDGELHELVKNFLLLIIDKRRETALPAIVSEYVDLANEARNIVIAEVTTAMPLNMDQQMALREKLSAITGKYVMLHVHTDARIMGGVVVQIGDKLIDGSVARQLSKLEAALTKIPLTKIGVTG